MCIRDSPEGAGAGCATRAGALRHRRPEAGHAGVAEVLYPCLLYTSDAADERSSVDLGGRRIIKKKKRNTELRRARHYHHIHE